MEFQRKKYKEFAVKQLSGRWKPAVIAMLIMAAISFIFSIPSSNLNFSWDELQRMAGYSPMELWNYLGNSGKVTPAQTIFGIIENLVALILEIAAAHFFLAYSRSPEPVPLKTYFEGFNKWGRGILTGLWQALWYTIWILVAVLAIVLCSIPLEFIFNMSETVMAVTELVLLVSALVLFIIKSIEYSHHFLLVAEFPELGIRKALRISILITRGHRWDIFVTGLTFIPLFILGLLTFGIGFLWIGPYMRMTYINVYHALLKDALETEKLHPEDFN